MPIRTGDQYLSGLRDHREVYMDGKRVEDVTKEPGLGELAHTIAKLFDMQHEGPHKDLFSYEEDGEIYNRAWFQPRSFEDLMLRQQYTQTQARLTGGMFGRLPEYVPLFHLGMLDVKEQFGTGDDRYIGNIVRYFEESKQQDRALSHAFVDIQVDPQKDLDDTPMLRVTKTSETGITVNGVKSIGTFVAQADEVLVGTFPRQGLKQHHVVYFSMPVSTPGIQVVARQPQAIGRGEFNHPVSRLGDENDTLLIFNDVEVPWERVFQYGADAKFAMGTFPLISEWPHWSILARLTAKTEMLVGLFRALPKLLGRERRADAMELYGEAVRYLFTLRAYLDSAAIRGNLTPNGNFMPNTAVVTSGRCYSVEHYRRLINGLQDIMGQGFIVVPTEGDLSSPDVGGVLQTVFGNSEQEAFDRVRLTRLGMDIAVEGFGGRQSLFEIFNATGVATIRASLTAQFNSEPYEELAWATAGKGDLEKAMADIEADWDPTKGLDLGAYDSVGDAYGLATSH